MKLYYTPARQSWFIKWKVDETWKLKAVPKEIQDESQARLWAATFMKDNVAPARIKPTFADVSSLWLERKEQQFKDDRKSLSGSRRLRNHWLGGLAQLPMEDCTVADASRWLEWVKQNTNASYTARNVLQAMRNFVVEARGRGWVEMKENVFLDPWIKRVLGTPRPKAGKGVIVRLPPEHVKALLNSRDLAADRRALYVVAVTTGLRAGELAAFRSSDIKKGCIHVTRQLTDGVLKPPKKGSVRFVPLCEFVQALVAGRSRLAVCNSRELRDDLNKASLPTTMNGHPITFHALRRTCLSMLRASGTPLEDIASIAGHSGLSVTDSVYAAPDIERLREHVERTFSQLASARKCK